MSCMKEQNTLLSPVAKKPNNATGADGVKIAVLRKGRASLEFI